MTQHEVTDESVAGVAEPRDLTKSENALDRVGRAKVPDYLTGSLSIWASKSVDHIWTIDVRFGPAISFQIVNGEIVNRPDPGVFKFEGSCPDGSRTTTEQLELTYPDDCVFQAAHHGVFLMPNGDVQTVDFEFRMEQMKGPKEPPYLGIVSPHYIRREFHSRYAAAAHVRQEFLKTAKFLFAIAAVFGLAIGGYYAWSWLNTLPALKRFFS